MPILDIKLVSRVANAFPENIKFNGSSDIDIDEFGGVVLCTGEGEGLEQAWLKSVLTGRQEEDGYGTKFKDVINI